MVVSLISSYSTCVVIAYLVAGDVPAALGHELLDALVDLGAGGNDLVLYILSDIRIT